MPDSPYPGPVCVTGATGYVAGHVVRELLQRGATVHATARDPSRQDKVGHLQALAEQHPGELKLFAADLLQDGSFDEAVAGCAVVMHTASPFIGGGSDPQTSLVDPAVKGTENVLGSVERTDSAQRVVLTSSVVACRADAREVLDRGGVLTEQHWTEAASLDYQPYPLSKMLAERRAWELADAQDRWRLVAVNPGFVMGPSLTSRNDSTSIDFLLAMIDGRRASGMFEGWTGWVDVREVATAHAEAALRPDAEGRHLLVSEVANFWQVGQWLKEDFGDRVRTPARKLPRAAMYLLGPSVGFGWRAVSRQIGLRYAVDNSRSVQRLGVQYRPLRQSLKDHVEQLIADGLHTPQG